ncbi:hypothetical protein J2Z83_002194 [Virgibacillus natechei]|uniref:Uncharacterized protein n=1 Tax=Virgibacillus natechei TaxID=1216297 RepID=A0ABS4IGK2_9BACI|nr:CBO0543 family protein [Virgibacillus natechei]MBP1970078.1 hypothetical protein [Virgibacillus natechei]UZD14159.1 hypothetical protein OLD84_06475 [Virgibacillus natechei]
MEKNHLESYLEIKSLKEQVTQLEADYWYMYSNIETWEFWVMLLLFFIMPLVVLYFLIDRSKIFLLGFYGFNIHVWFGYTNSWGDRQGLWGYPHELAPFLTGNISLEATLIPVAFMLVYQWTLNNNKNYYLYTLGLTIFLSFIIKPVLTLHDLFELHKGANFLHLFLMYIGIFLFSKLITTVFIKMQKNQIRPT